MSSKGGVQANPNVISQAFTIGASIKGIKGDIALVELQGKVGSKWGMRVEAFKVQYRKILLSRLFTLSRQQCQGPQFS